MGDLKMIYFGHLHTQYTGVIHVDDNALIMSVLMIGQIFDQYTFF